MSRLIVQSDEGSGDAFGGFGGTQQDAQLRLE